MSGAGEHPGFPPERVKAAQEVYLKSGGMPARLREEMMLDVLKGAHSVTCRLGSHLCPGIVLTVQALSCVLRLTVTQATQA